jgi:hypothetical protein
MYDVISRIFRKVGAPTHIKRSPFHLIWFTAEPGLTQLAFAPLIHHRKGLAMNITLSLVPIVSLIAGILIFIMPRLLSTIVAIYLIMVGLVGLFGSGHFLR